MTRRIKYGREGKPEGWGRERSGKVHKKTNVILHCLGVMLYSLVHVNVYSYLTLVSFPGCL